MLVLCDRSKCSFEDVEALVELLVGDHKWDQNAHHVVVRPCRDGDKAVLVTIAGDFLGFRLRGLTCGGAADELDGAHAAKAANVANQRPFLLPAAGTLFKTLSDGSGPGE